jgi:hypothetical protein
MLVDDDTKTIGEKYVASPLLCRSHDYFEVLSDSSSGVVEPVTLDIGKIQRVGGLVI